MFPQEKKLEHFSPKQNPSLDPRKRRKELTQKSKRRRKNMPRAAKEKAVFWKEKKETYLQKPKNQN